MSNSYNYDSPQEMELLISRQFDGELSLQEHQCLQEWINSDPEHAKTFVELAMLHDRLLARPQPEGVGGEFVSGAYKSPFLPSKNQQRVRWAIGAFSSLAALMLISFFVFQMSQGTPALAAEIQLERLIEVARKSSDRTYLITTLDLPDDKRRRAKRNRNRLQKQNTRREKKAQAPVDGALLHLRGERSYVLNRRYANGDEFITGSDGNTSWSVPIQGRVRVSDNASRFQSGMPGNQHAIPFINLHDDLEQIRGAYNIQWLDSESDSQASHLEQRCLIAQKKSPEHRGPKHVEIWFDADTGIITELLLDKLPQGKGGPETVLLELIDQSELAEDFFEHTSHHDSNRKVKNEIN